MEALELDAVDHIVVTYGGTAGSHDNDATLAIYPILGSVNKIPRG
jgi:hypothetical protein